MMLHRQRPLLIHSYTKSIWKLITDNRIIYHDVNGPSKGQLDDRFEEHISWLAELDTLASERTQFKKNIYDLLEKQLRKNNDIVADWQLAKELQAFMPLFERHLDTAKGLASEFLRKYDPLEVFLNFFDLSAIGAVLELMLDDGTRLGTIKKLIDRNASSQVLIRGLSNLLSEESQSQQKFVSNGIAACEKLQRILIDVKFRNQID